MTDGFAYLDILFFAMVAAFIAFRLRSVLGRRTGHERRRPSRVEHANATASDNVVRMPNQNSETEAASSTHIDVEDAAAREGLRKISEVDRSFDLSVFLEGAKAAFQMIIDAFARGDRDTLRPLLANSVYSGFDGAIAEREQRGETLQTNIVSMQKADVVEASLVGHLARIAVKFVTEQTITVSNSAGEVIEGDASATDEVVDVWTFERDTRSSDPNWLLVETRTASS